MNDQGHERSRQQRTIEGTVQAFRSIDGDRLRLLAGFKIVITESVTVVSVRVEGGLKVEHVAGQRHHPDALVRDRAGNDVIRFQAFSPIADHHCKISVLNGDGTEAVVFTLTDSAASFIKGQEGVDAKVTFKQGVHS